MGWDDHEYGKKEWVTHGKKVKRRKLKVSKEELARQQAIAKRKAEWIKVYGKANPNG